jgi:hypothetical protein
MRMRRTRLSFSGGGPRLTCEIVAQVPVPRFTSLRSKTRRPYGRTCPRPLNEPESCTAEHSSRPAITRAATSARPRQRRRGKSASGLRRQRTAPAPTAPAEAHQISQRSLLSGGCGGWPPVPPCEPTLCLLCLWPAGAIAALGGESICGIGVERSYLPSSESKS